MHVKITGRRVGNQPSRPDFIMMAPKGDQALAQMLNQLYVITVPKIGGVPSISVANPSASPFPSRQLTEIGGEFASWDSKGEKVYFAIGNAFHWYDLKKAEEIDEIIKKKKKKKKRKKKQKPRKRRKMLKKIKKTMMIKVMTTRMMIKTMMVTTMR